MADTPMNEHPIPTRLNVRARSTISCEAPDASAPPAKVHEGSLRPVDGLRGRNELALRRAEEKGLAPGSKRPLLHRTGLLHVRGDVHQDGAAPSGVGELEGLAQRPSCSLLASRTK